MLALRPPELRSRPCWWDDQERANAIFPVVGVTWFEAEAYANWLAAHPEQLRLGGGVPTGYRVRLATEEEWERAARGTDGREYPWQGEFDFAKANVAEEIGKGIGATAVCTYPQGVSPAGAWDMAGNVWEWTRSPYARMIHRPWCVGGRGTLIGGTPAAPTVTGSSLSTSTSILVFGWLCPYRLLVSDFWLLWSSGC